MTSPIAPSNGPSEPAAGKAPERRYVFTAKIGCDSKADLASMLSHILYELDTHSDTMNVVTGGCSSGGYYDLKHDPEMTAEKYQRELRRYLDSLKKADA